MAKCKQSTPLPFKGLNTIVQYSLVYVLCCCLHGVIKHDDDDDKLIINDDKSLVVVVRGYNDDIVT